VWVYYSAIIMLIGAEFTQVYAQRFGSNIEPNRHAVPTSKTQNPAEVATKREPNETRNLTPPTPSRLAKS
jgi:membrane protein